MVCRKCRTALPDGSKYCLSCGAKQDITRRPRSRGNGTGSVYQLPSKTWIAVRICGWYTAEDGSVRRKTRSKSGFRTKKEALEYLPLLAATPAQERSRRITYKELYDKWFPTHRAGKSTLGCYRAAIKHFQPLWGVQLADIDVDDLQECMDDCPAGKRTKENMKALCGLLYKYAIPRHLATLNLGEYLIVGGGVSEEKRALPMEVVQALQQAGPSVPYGEYIVAQCYLGFRPSELLALDIEDYDPQRRIFVGGAKTEAGRNRIVTISPKIQPIIDRLVGGRTSGPVFVSASGGRLSLRDYRAAFYAALDAISFDNPMEESNGVVRHRYTPHSCRHTFATLLRKRRAVFAVDGYEISATFADSRNTAVLGHVKQILLSSFANNLTDKTPGDSLALKAKLSDNNSGDTPMHLEKFIYPVY